MKIGTAIVLTGIISITVAARGAITAYDNLGTSATAGYSEPNANNPIFGDQLTLTQGGVLAGIGLSLFNSSSGGNTGSILTGSTLVKFYDNTVPYSGGPITGSLLGSATLLWDFTSIGGLPSGSYATDDFDISALSIIVPQNILVTQQFTETSGTSTRNGFVLFGNPTIGSSPATVYIKSTATAEGLYTFSGNPNQVGFTVTLVPEPATGVLLGLGGASLLVFRRRNN